MSYRALTEEEGRYLACGGRVFLISDKNEIVILKGDNVHIISNKESETVMYETKEVALQTAMMIASLSEDLPMVEGEVEDPWPGTKRKRPTGY